MSMLLGPNSTRTTSVSLRLCACATDAAIRTASRSVDSLRAWLMNGPPSAANRLPFWFIEESTGYGTPDGDGCRRREHPDTRCPFSRQHRIMGRGWPARDDARRGSLDSVGRRTLEA